MIINLDNVQHDPIEVTASLTAVLNRYYVNTASATYTDPTPAQGNGFIVYVKNGTATVGGTAYSTAGTIIYRYYHSGAWGNTVVTDPSGSYQPLDGDLTSIASLSSTSAYLRRSAANTYVLDSYTTVAGNLPSTSIMSKVLGGSFNNGFFAPTNTILEAFQSLDDISLAYLIATDAGGGSGSTVNAGTIIAGNTFNVADRLVLSLNATGGTFGLDGTGSLTFPNAATATRGLLTSTDWNTFNNKAPLTSPAFLTSTSLTLTDAVTNAATTVKTLVHNSSGAIAANFGLSTLVQLQSTTTAARDAGKSSWAWSTATDATRTSKYSISLVNNGGALTEYYRFNPNGYLTLYGAVPGFIFSPNTDDRFILAYPTGRLQLSHQLSPFSQVLIYQDKVIINCDGSTYNRLALNNTSPTAQIHIAAGTASANTAPLKFTAGTNLTTAENGAIEYNGTNFFATRTGAVREGILTQSAVTTEVVVSDRTVTVNINGTTYKLLAKA